MISCIEIAHIIQSSEKENISRELKSIRKLFGDEDRKETLIELAKDFSAMANRFGGTFIFGLNDDGTFDPKGEFNIDKSKELIHQICFDRISPHIDCSISYLDCDLGDILIVTIPKKKDIPHAVVKRSNGEIHSRDYYIRTSHGKRRVSDSQLEWLFKQQDDPNYSADIRVGIEWNKDLGTTGNEIPGGHYYVSNFINRIPRDQLLGSENEYDRFTKIVIELLPFIILKSIADYYRLSWYIGRHSWFDRYYSGPMRESVPIKKVNIAELHTEGSKYLFIPELSFRNTLGDLFKDPFCIPEGAELKISYENDSASIEILHEDFSIMIRIAMMSAGSGLHPKNPLRLMLVEKYSTEGDEFQKLTWRHFDGGISFEATFPFPERDVEMFNKYHHYSKTLKDLIDENWNYQKTLEKLPPKEILLLDAKLDDIIKKINDIRP